MTLPSGAEGDVTKDCDIFPTESGQDVEQPLPIRVGTQNETYLPSFLRGNKDFRNR